MRDTIEKHNRDPILRIVKKDAISVSRTWMIRVAAFVGALLAGALLILALGHNPIDVYVDMVRGSLGTQTVIYDTVKIVVPLLITAIAISIAFRMRFWNIGAEGQIIVGALAAASFGLFMGDQMPKVVLVIAMMVAGMIAGGLYGLLPAFCKAKWGTNETLFTLMLNYIALYIIKYLQNGPWKNPGSSFPQIGRLDMSNRLTKVLGVHWGWIVALILVVATHLYISKTKHGYEISVVGESPATARYAGIRVGKVFMRTMFISGALAGLVGMFQFAGTDYTITEGTAGGVGFTAITVAWMAKMNPYAMLVVSFFLAILERGSNTIQTHFLIPASAAELLTGLILFFMLGSEFFLQYSIVFRKKATASASQKRGE